jgi:hypothetical protein
VTVPEEGRSSNSNDLAGAGGVRCYAAAVVAGSPGPWARYDRVGVSIPHSKDTGDAGRRWFIPDGPDLSYVDSAHEHVITGISGRLSHCPATL